MADTVQNAVQASTKNSSEAQGIPSETITKREYIPVISKFRTKKSVGLSKRTQKLRRTKGPAHNRVMNHKAFGAVRDSKVASVHTIIYFLEYEAKELQEAHISDVDDDLKGATQPAHSRRTWNFVVDEFIHRFLPEEVLKSTHDAVACVGQEPG